MFGSNAHERISGSSGTITVTANYGRRFPSGGGNVSLTNASNGAAIATSIAEITGRTADTITVLVRNLTASIQVNATTEAMTWSFPTSGTITGTRPGLSSVTAGSWTASAAVTTPPNSSHVTHDATVTVTISLNPGFRHHANTAITTSSTGGSYSGAGGTRSAVSGTDGTRTFTIQNVRSAITAIGVGDLAIQTFSVTYSRNGPPANHNGGAVSAQIANSTKIWDVAMTLTTSRYTVANSNWEQIGWTTAAPAAGNNNNVLNHRQFARTTTAGHWTPNGTSTWGAGASVVHADGHTVTWDVPQQIPASVNSPVTLYPIWAPRQTTVSFQLGTVPPGSGTINGSTPNQRHLTHNEFTFPDATFTVETGATWEQIGWTRTLDIHSRVVRPLEETLPVTGTHVVANGYVVEQGSAESNDHVLWPGTNVTYYPVWRRVITDGNVNVVFVGAPEGFMDTALARLDISATMPFEIPPGTDQLLHAGKSEAIVLPSFNEMNDLAQEFDLIFQGWYIRTAWEPSTTRIDDPEDPDAAVMLPPSVWPLGIFPQLWEPYIWIEARWGNL